VLGRLFRHNLRNELNIIMGYTEMITTEMSEDELNRYLDKINQTAEELEEQSNKIRRFQELIENRNKYSPQMVEVRSLLERVADEIRSKYPETEVHDEIPDTETSLTVDSIVEFEVKEAADNAVRHNDREDPKVEITASVNEETREIEISISDNGPEISEYEKDVLDVGTETPLKHGSGVGLWSIQWILNTVGGRVSIEDNDESGSTVVFELPYY
ncbi:MAG: HAMP domain-containing sensor histidine kinase, partial [Halobacteria archaeon]|nr:HAMP domain-containing sensor histidine kinase [Halobacteria archaeon]